MVSKIVIDYLRNLSKRLETIACDGGVVDWEDIPQLIDLAATLDEERERGLESILAEFAAREKTILAELAEREK